MGAELVSSLAGRGARRTAPALTLRRQRLGCLKNNALSLQRLRCWNDKPDSPSAAAAGGHGAANHMVQLGGRRSRALLAHRPQEYVLWGSLGTPCGSTCPGACTSLPHGQPSAQRLSWSTSGGRCFGGVGCGARLAGKFPLQPLHVLPQAGGWVQHPCLGCAGGDTPTITLSLHRPSLCSCVL